MSATRIDPPCGDTRPPAWRAMKNLEENLGYSFHAPKLLEQALTHSSRANEGHEICEHNERLEFLGDAVLELSITAALYRDFGGAREGEMTEMRAALVSEPSLAALARGIGVDAALRLGRGEEKQAGRRRDSILADAMEAIFGAIFLDGGFEQANAAILGLFAPVWPKEMRETKKKDPKSLLQEICQKTFKNMPIYTLESATGPPHAKTYEIMLLLPNGERYRARDSAHKRAEQAAAALALKGLGLDH